MPIYEYYCRECKNIFEKYYPSSATEKMKATTCPSCGSKALRHYGSRFSSPGKLERQFVDDEPAYREMHYYEKKKDWERAATAAEGVSKFAKEKFLQKAKEEG